MSEKDKSRTQEVQIARMQANIEHMTGSIDKLNVNMEKAYDRSEKMNEQFNLVINEISRQMNTFGVLINSITSIQNQVTENSNWISENRYSMKELVDERLDFKKRKKDIIQGLFAKALPYIFIIVGLFTMYVINQKSIAEVSQGELIETINQLVKQ